MQIKAATEELQKESMTLGQAMYQQGGGGAAGGGEAPPGGEAPGGGAPPKGDDVIDAEFTDSDNK